MAEAVTKQQLIINLNEDLKLEFSAALQYIQHASCMQGAQFDSIREHLLEHADQEIDHAKQLSERINYMGGIPVAVPNLDEIKLSSDSRYMLALDLSSERTAVLRYKERIEQAVSLREYGLVQMLQEILEEEEEHEDDLVTSLGEGLVVAPATPAQVADSFVKLASLEQNRKALKTSLR